MPLPGRVTAAQARKGGRSVVQHQRHPTDTLSMAAPETLPQVSTRLPDPGTGGRSVPSGTPEGRRFAAALVGYLAVATLIVTWVPFNFGWPDRWWVDVTISPEDVVLNILLFLPLGVFWSAWRADREGGRPPWIAAGAAGLLLSLVIETGQFLLPDRHTSPVDLVTNATGAALGAWLLQTLRPALRLRSSPAAVLALDLPLTGLLLLATPLPWLVAFGSGGGERLWLLLPLAGFGGGILGALHGGYLASPPPEAIRHRRAVALAGGWFAVVALPGVFGRVDVLAAGGMVTLVAAWLGSLATHRRRGAPAGDAPGERRVELPTLRFVLPLFASYLALSALWPFPDAAEVAAGGWIGGWSLTPADPSLTRFTLIRALELLGAFTLVGYITAEFHGRGSPTPRSLPPAVASPSEGTRPEGSSNEAPEAWVGPVSGVVLFLAVVLVGAQGWHPALGASLPLGILAVAAGVFGGAMYRLHRAHIRSLLRRPA